MYNVAFDRYTNFRLNFMKSAKPKRPRMTRDISIEEFGRAWFDLLGRPGIAAACWELAEEEGISLEVLMLQTLVAAYRQSKRPLPEAIRDHIATHPDIPDAKRRNLLENSLQ